MTSKHTELPWVVSEASCGIHDSETVAIYHYPDSVSIVEVVETGCKCGDEALSKDDADYIVLCANYHHRLRGALGAVVDQWTNGDGTFGSIEQARALLAELDNLDPKP